MLYKDILQKCYYRNMPSQNLCYCGSAVEYHLGKTGKHNFTHDNSVKIRRTFGSCYCGSAVEHCLGKAGVTGPIPVSSSIQEILENPSKIGTFKDFLF